MPKERKVKRYKNDKDKIFLLALHLYNTIQKIMKEGSKGKLEPRTAGDVIAAGMRQTSQWLEPLAVEMWLKAISVRNQGDHLGTHDLAHLWADISQKDRRQINNKYNKLKKMRDPEVITNTYRHVTSERPDLQWTERDMDNIRFPKPTEVLRYWKNGFTEFRYKLLPAEKVTTKKKVIEIISMHNSLSVLLFALTRVFNVEDVPEESTMIIPKGLFDKQ